MKKEIPYRGHAKIALLLFLITVSLGVALRYAAVFSFSFNFKNVVHAHSHVALLGWVYVGLTTLIGKYFIKNHAPRKIYHRILGFTLLCVFGMAVSFPIQGYGLFSILFSSLFIISSYLYTWMFFKYIPKIERQSNAYKTVKYALIYMLISSIGPWSIGGIMATLGPSSPFYHSSIYFYLHYQYDAWMVLALLAVFLRILEQKDIVLPTVEYNQFLRILHVGINLTFLLSILYLSPPFWIYMLAIVGAIFQLNAFYRLFLILVAKLKSVRQLFSPLATQMLLWATFLLASKGLFQFFGAFPPVADLITMHKSLTIGFLHWVLLGGVSIGILGFFSYSRLAVISKLNWHIYLVGFILTEIFIFYQPLSLIFDFPLISNYPIWLLAIGIITALSVASFSIYTIIKEINTSFFKNKTLSHKTV